MGWYIAGGYAIAWIVTARILFSTLLGEWENRDITALNAIALGLAWPPLLLAVCLYPVYLFIVRPTREEKRTDRLKDAEEELLQLKDLARKHNLPIPELDGKGD